METRMEQRPDPRAMARFWERMAGWYPLPFDPKTLTETLRVLDLVREKGVDFTQARVLDVGCGTGIHTLPIGREASWAVGLDGSELMIARMKEQIAEAGIGHVKAVLGSWQDLDIQELGFEKAFDIVWASMTPAVRSLQDFKKMEACSKTWCVLIGWGRKRDNLLMKEAFGLHGLEFGPPPGVTAFHDLLTGQGRTPSLDYFDTSWEWTGTLDEAVDHFAGFIDMQGVTPDRPGLYRLLEDHLEDGRLRNTTRVEEGLLVWRVDRD